MNKDIGGHVNLKNNVNKLPFKISLDIKIKYKKF